MTTSPSPDRFQAPSNWEMSPPESLEWMLSTIDLAVPTLCLGIDVTWWGGSRKRRDSQRDTIVYTIVQAATAPDLQFSLVDLSAAPNPRSDDLTESNFDADGELLAIRVAEILAENKGRYQRCVVALDAPLEAQFREKQPKRVRAAKAKTKTGAKQRQCEEMIQKRKESDKSPKAKEWRSGLQIQSGSPVPLRIASILEKLKSNCGLVCWGMDRSSHEGQVIEIFPSEAIWSLGLMSGYSALSPGDVRSYKNKKPISLSRNAAVETALRPLLGFAECFESQVSLPLRRWCEQIADYACAIAKDDKCSETVKKGKGFDDPIESGIAFFTAVSFVSGVYHVWGDGADGTIVGPGRI